MNSWIAEKMKGKQTLKVILQASCCALMFALPRFHSTSFAKLTCIGNLESSFLTTRRFLQQSFT